MNVETEYKQALGALELVTGQRDRLRHALRILAFIADERGRRLSPQRVPPPLLAQDLLRAMGLRPGDLDGDA